MKRYLMGIDNGGSDIKCAIFDLKGQEVAVSSTQVALDIPEPGFTERDADKVWKANIKVIRDAMEQAGIAGEEVAAVGLTGYGNGMVLTDELGRAVYPAIVSTDDRASGYCKKFREDGTERKLFPYTRQTTWSAQPAVMLPWFRDHLPGVLEKTRWVLGIKDYIRFHLTGEFATEITEASSGCLVDLDTRRFERKLFEFLGIEDCYQKMPPIFESAEISGRVTEAAAKLTGLEAGTPVAAGYFDIDANALASGILSSEELCLIAGTWSINEYLSKEASKDIDSKENVATLSYLKDYYIMEDSTPTSASNFNWFIKSLLRPERPDAAISEIYQECNKLVEAIAPQDSDVIFVPYLFGSATHQDAKGAFLNLTGADDRNTMLRAVYEGVVFSSAHHVYNLKRPIESYTKARLSGGVSNSEVWSQMMSDVLQISIETLAGDEPGAKGAAMGAGVACGVFASLEEAVEKMVNIGKTYYPRKEYADIYARKFKRYEAALQAVDMLAETI
ncbi:FGGY-family carbohydrate kinase [Ohessyouella blattaphilus]|uniref:Carbohydrate kinase n=1 Tax=Ohessyouella blattaphilus TaxID=2949333 RepID=A0ABT1EIA3_9FIRM|nr:FGGY-family carbohydrate kinase [Ohessyouella blattaphilus]MCP1110413.1 carbohydrate kinase [Ohessyouella blattaphilus]MCR8563807.1 carbohydrate kinase [Ohessyouella blattaphilus]